MRTLLPWLLGPLAILFGVITLRVGGAVLLDVGSARAAHGQFVPFVLWFNVLSGFAYVVAGVGIVLQRRWAAWVALAITVGLAVTGLAFAGHILMGGAYEPETVAAMAMRFGIWTGLSVYAFRRHCRGTLPEHLRSQP